MSTMGLSIKNEDVEARVRRLAALTGEGVTEAIDNAVVERLARIEHTKSERARARLAALDAALARLGPRPPLDRKAIDEELYDEQGLPR
ncbi:MAG: type II toxin-antitoxin system VapB family antitoxin [Hyphomonadaceae bacterium]|nr:type II toxin-antitoxin system VapB family antitoxin [Hyphomonadaceae bacterium]